MAEKRRKRMSSRRFALGMIIYALVFVVLLAIGLRVLWSVLYNYDREEPRYAIDRYMQSFDEEHIRALSRDFVATLDPALKSEEESFRVIEDLFQNLHYSRISKESTDTHLVYAILADRRYLGSMELDDTGKRGDEKWAVTRENFEFSDLLNSDEVLVPAEWQVYCNGSVLGDQYITETGIRYPSMEEAYDYGFALPTLVRYHLENYIGTLAVEVRDAEGNVAELQDDPSLYTLRDNCTSEVRDRMADFTQRLLPLYIAFMSNTNHNAYDNYARVHPYLLPGSDLESRFYGAIAGQVYSHSKGDYLHDVVVNGVFSLGESRYLIDVDYKVDTTGNAGTIENDAGMLIVAVDQGSAGIFASEIFIK